MKSDDRPYNGSRLIDFNMVLISLSCLIIIWIPDVLSNAELKIMASAYFVLIFALAVKCLCNGGDP